MNKVNKGRNFEKLVAEIEQAFSGSTAEIKLNDRIPDTETGKLREIDISIRANVGSMDLLTIVECRDRSQKADARWIEELDGKRQSVGAHKVVAVSRSGFTEEALTKAKNRNIEARTLKKLKQREIREWIDAHPISVYHTQMKHVEGEIVFHEDIDVQGKFKDMEWFDEAGQPLPLFKRQDDGKLMNVIALFRWAYWLLNGKEPEAGVSEEPQARRVEIGFQPGALKMQGVGWEYDVSGVRLGFVIRVIPMKLQSVEQYSSGERDIAEKVVWGENIELNGRKVPLSIEATLSR